MTPEQMAERLAAWEREPESWHDRGLDPVTRRVVCLEPDGPRRTWALYEGGRQCGHVRMRADVVAWDSCGRPRAYGNRWHIEASDRTRAMLGLGES